MDSTDLDRTTAFDYLVYLRATPDQVWEALTEPAHTSRYWGLTLHSDWKPGSTVVWQGMGLGDPDPEQVVLAAEPGRSLSFTWHTFTPAFAEAVGMDEELRARLAAESRSKIAYDIEPTGPTVTRLHLVHDGFDPGSTVLAMIREGWPSVLSSLKSLLETGEPLPELA
ncbi:SRPBCC domain-containing protein [Streptomyces sp. NBC_00237]|uniref:SRPBCC domain-containing protein n=1 Tax=Streptomyces sp. NBC_00237 TaxID=2975687 RepID=UPI00225773E1|nr:SRPBCC domain-containing protein [Streptomyces sp. NBC_00237]MCX5203119.1 SRPBCC domain-containing protein [Streptomyces sp. NBC_00237]